MRYQERPVNTDQIETAPHGNGTLGSDALDGLQDLIRLVFSELGDHTLLECCGD